MLIHGRILSNQNDLSEVYSIRRKVFLEEMNLSQSYEYDEYDEISMHVIVYEDEEKRKAVATGRIYFDGELCEISRIAVLKKYRMRRYGDFALRMLLNKAFTSGISVVRTYVNSDCISFFEKIGFKMVVEERTNSNLYIMEIHDSELKSICHRI